MHLTGTPITFRAIHGLVWAAFKPHQPSDLRPQTVYPFSSKRYDDQRPQHAGSLQNTLPHRLHPPRRRELRQRRRGVWDDPAQRKPARRPGEVQLPRRALRVCGRHLLPQ
ncbi:hypothetical protein AcV7_002184 [Taiwanofungus camphoratus]|nr:hypothetical protein AcV7_002184 [Antrodia cinnamomea]